MPLDQRTLYVQYEYSYRFKKGDPPVKTADKRVRHRFRERYGPNDVIKELKVMGRLIEERDNFLGRVFEYNGRKIDISVYPGDRDEGERKVISLVM